MNDSQRFPSRRTAPLADIKSCNDWLASATLADPRQACATLLSLLEELEQALPIHIEYMRILKRLRKHSPIANLANCGRC